MVITITCNPAIDKTVYENKTVFDIGGKGINVSKVLKEFGIDSIATGFVGKENSKLIIDDLNNNNIENHFIEVEGYVRTNTKRIVQYKLIEENEDGPSITIDDENKLFDYISKFNNDVVIISGSCSIKEDKNIYKKLIDILKTNNNFVILDCAGDLLKNAVKAKPDIIKPNKDEICNLFDIEYNEETIIKKCRELDIDFICVSLGGQGAIFINNDIYRVKPLKINCVSSVGAGDAMVAALAYAKINGLNIEETIKIAMAASMAACETEGTKAPTYKEVMKKYRDIML